MEEALDVEGCTPLIAFHHGFQHEAPRRVLTLTPPKSEVRPTTLIRPPTSPSPPQQMRQVQILQEPVNRLRVQPKYAHRLPIIPIPACERRFDQSAFGLVNDVVVAGRLGFGDLYFLGGKVPGEHEFGDAQDHRVFHGVLKFPDVTGPGAVFEDGHGFERNASDLAAGFRCVLRNEVPGEGRDVFAPLA